ncbi:hypothetical protein pipiens_014881 [Culex pipiens pipiens]|uniref:Uncharacterized protein n=1 Tax=Culex pipiens pipiens TaxID=38569 RepID=A0ABD1CSS9_CULPP
MHLKFVKIKKYLNISSTRTRRVWIKKSLPILAMFPFLLLPFTLVQQRYKWAAAFFGSPSNPPRVFVAICGCPFDLDAAVPGGSWR